LRDGLSITELPGGQTMLGGWTSAAGATLAWAAGLLGAESGPGGFSESAAVLEPGAGGLLTLPYLEGERTPVWDPDARGVVVGLTGSTTRIELYRAFLDGVALSAHDLSWRLAQAGHTPSEWHLAGGGIHDAAWSQATCDALDRPAFVIDVGRGVAAALFGLRALGSVVTMPISATLNPEPRRTAKYARLYEVYCGLYAQLADAMHTLTQMSTE
jgi:xylulokinase